MAVRSGRAAIHHVHTEKAARPYRDPKCFTKFLEIFYEIPKFISEFTNFFRKTKNILQNSKKFRKNSKIFREILKMFRGNLKIIFKSPNEL